MSIEEGSSRKELIGRVLVVDDHEPFRTAICEAIQEVGILAVGVADAETALDRISDEFFEICVNDIRLPQMQGIELLRRIRELSPETMVIMVTAFGRLETAIESLRAGATDYILKPFAPEALLNKLRLLMDHRSLELEVRSLRRIVDSATSPSRMVGNSPAIEEIRRLIGKVVATRSPVLITGESGTGKELVARVIHQTSSSQNAPFIPINCAATQETPLASELFGHAEGAFGGAITSKEGVLKVAGKGTVFLDDIADTPRAVQDKLVRALQSRHIQPLGSLQQIPTEARIIAALNKDLDAELTSGRLRRDLYYRLAVLHINVPPLRSRREDIPALVDHFVNKYNLELGRTFVGASQDALQRLVGYHWRGNVRELENVLERAMIIAERDLIERRDLPDSIQAATPVPPDALMNLRRASRQFELTHINQVLSHCDGDKKKAARLLGLSLSSLYRKLDRG